MISRSPGTFPGKKKPTLAFVCAGDPLDVLTWSGTPLHMLTALRGEFDVTTIIRQPWPRWFSFCRRAVRRLSRGAIDLYWSPAWSKLAASRTISQLVESDCDAVFAVAITPICAEVVKHRPTIFVSDATQASMVNYNPRHNALLPRLKKAAAALESLCIQRAALSLFPSDWASRSAVADHGGSTDRVVQIPWGPNLLADDIVPPEARSPTKWRLLFVGANWKGKGGDIALDTVAELRRRGYDVHIDVVGSEPSPRPEREGVTFHGFLDKNAPADHERMKALFAQAHAFFLPTQFDALGIVFAEAASFALPAVSYRTGGVPSMVQHGTTGVLLTEGSDAAAFADALASLLSDRQRYLRMSHAALAASQDRLNWSAWAASVRRAVEERLADRALVGAASARRHLLVERDEGRDRLAVN